MLLELPLYNNGELEFKIVSERKCCGENCLIGNSKFVAFHTLGLGREGNHMDYSLVTEKHTLIKKRKSENYVWNKLSYSYEVNIKQQKEIFEQLIETPNPGMIPVINQCACSYEVSLLKGKMAYYESLPITSYYKLNFSYVEKWNKRIFNDFVKQTSDDLFELHKRGFIHGDLTAQNYLVDDDNEKFYLIDLDTLSYGTQETFYQDVVAYILFVVTPILRTFETEEFIQQFLVEFFNNQDWKRMYDDTWIPCLFSALETKTVSGYSSNPLVTSYYYLEKTLRVISEDNRQSVNKVQGLQTEILETNRIKELAASKQNQLHQEEMKNAEAYAVSLQDNLKETELYVKSLQKKIEDIEAYAKSLEENKTEIEAYVNALKNQISETESHVGSLVEKNHLYEKEKNEAHLILTDLQAKFEEVSARLKEQEKKKKRFF